MAGAQQIITEFILTQETRVERTREHDGKGQRTEPLYKGSAAKLRLAKTGGWVGVPQGRQT